MAKVEIDSKNWCPFCARAKEHLDRKGVPYVEIDVTTDSISLHIARRIRVSECSWQSRLDDRLQSHSFS